MFFLIPAPALALRVLHSNKPKAMRHGRVRAKEGASPYTGNGTERGWGNKGTVRADGDGECKP